MRADPTALRFGAITTTIVLALVLVTETAWPLAAQAVIFALVVVWRSPHTMLLRTLVSSVRKEMEDAAALLNAAFGFRLGCEMYLLVRRLLPAAKMEVSQ
ncbi:DUF4395 family protein [Nonomuraea sp. NPDC046802]|uniref:DUF4395 family protein n=1 Tax=Nonomuraea sp. NPDC046802 TaxID=3154919 RepID=UPI0034070C99